MTVYAEHLSTEAQQFNWLLTQFAANTPEVIDAIAVSSDGLLIAISYRLDRAKAEHDPFLIYVQTDPNFDSLRDDSALVTLLK